MRIFICLLIMLTTQLKGQSIFHEGLEIGPNAVGFKVFQLTDNSRTYGSNDRPIALSVWYPTSSNTQHRLAFEDYVKLDGYVNTTDSKATKVVKAYIEKVEKRGADRRQIEALLDERVLAQPNAKIDEGKKHLIISIQGGGRPAHTQFILNEYLASRGYIVVSISDIRSHPDRQNTTIESNMKAISADVSFILEYLFYHDEFEIDKVGGMAFSKAGEALLLNQVLDERFDAQAFMDAQPGQYALTYIPQEGLAQMSIPMLAFFSNHQGRISTEMAKKDTSAFEFIQKNDLLKIRLMQANHGDLTSSAILGDLVPNFNRWQAFGDSKLSHQTLIRVTALFFDRYLQGERTERKVEQLIVELPTDFIVIHKKER